MGYEHTLYAVIEHTDLKNDEGKFWAEVVGKINLGKCPLDVDWDIAKGYIYADDGTTVIEKDDYGKPIGVAYIKDVINKLDEYSENSDYWRYPMARDFLKSIAENWRQQTVWEKFGHHLTVYHYGH